MLYANAILLASLASTLIGATPVPLTVAADPSNTSSLFSVTNFFQTKTGPYPEFYTYPFGYFAITFTIRGSQFSPLGTEFATQCEGKYDSGDLETNSKWYPCREDGTVEFRSYYILSEVDLQGGQSPETQVLEVRRTFTAVEEEKKYIVYAKATVPVKDGGFANAFSLEPGTPTVL